MSGWFGDIGKQLQDAGAKAAELAAKAAQEVDRLDDAFGEKVEGWSEEVTKRLKSEAAAWNDAADDDDDDDDDSGWGGGGGGGGGGGASSLPVASG